MSFAFLQVLVIEGFFGVFGQDDFCKTHSSFWCAVHSGLLRKLTNQIRVDKDQSVPSGSHSTCTLQSQLRQRHVQTYKKFTHLLPSFILYTNTNTLGRLDSNYHHTITYQLCRYVVISCLPRSGISHILP